MPSCFFFFQVGVFSAPLRRVRCRATVQACGLLNSPSRVASPASIDSACDRTLGGRAREGRTVETARFVGHITMQDYHPGATKKKINGKKERGREIRDRKRNLPQPRQVKPSSRRILNVIHQNRWGCSTACATAADGTKKELGTEPGKMLAATRESGCAAQRKASKRWVAAGQIKGPEPEPRPVVSPQLWSRQSNPAYGFGWTCMSSAVRLASCGEKKRATVLGLVGENVDGQRSGQPSRGGWSRGLLPGWVSSSMLRVSGYRLHLRVGRQGKYECLLSSVTP